MEFDLKMLFLSERSSRTFQTIKKVGRSMTGASSMMAKPPIRILFIQPWGMAMHATVIIKLNLSL